MGPYGMKGNGGEKGLKGEKLWGKKSGRVLAGALSPQPYLSPQVAASAFSPPPWPTAPTSLAARPQWAATQEAGAGRRWPPGHLAGMLGGKQRQWHLPSPPNANRMPRSRFSEVWPSESGGRDAEGRRPSPRSLFCCPQPGSTTPACSAWHSAAPELYLTTASRRTRARSWRDSATC